MSTLRHMTAQELIRVHEIDVSESGSTVYRIHEGAMKLTPETWQRRRRGPAEWTPYVEEWAGILAGGGIALGAFDEHGEDQNLVGIAVLRLRLTPIMAQLAGLFVSRDQRRRGIAARLVDEVVCLAQEGGARALYVSATPSESAVGFYLSHGFTLAREVHPDLYAREPEDIHLTRTL